MRRIILIFTLALLVQVSFAQKSEYNSKPDLLYNQGKEMFLGGNWTGAIDLLQQFSYESKDKLLQEESAYMIAVSAFRMKTVI